MKHVQLQVCRSKATARLSVSSEMSELLQGTRLPYLSNLQSQANNANPGPGLSWSGHGNTRKAQMGQIRHFPLLRSKGAAGGT